MHADLILRTIKDDHELHTLHDKIVRTFVGKHEAQEMVDAYDVRMRQAPDLPPDGRRGIFIDEAIASACLVYQRQIRIGYSYVPVACIGAVFTDPEHRGRGLAGRLITDIIGYAAARRDGLLLLDGINGFYDRFGFVSVYNWTQYSFQIDEILHGPRAAVSIRTAHVDDARDLQKRYFRHFARYTGSFLRTPEQQRHQLQPHNPYTTIDIAHNAQARLAGHLRRHDLQPGTSSEVSADDPATAIALLRHHAQVARDRDPEIEALHWLIPPQSELASWLADRYEVVIRTPVQPHGGWMARIADLDVWINAMIPTWKAYLLASSVAWHGTMQLCIGTDCYALQIGQNGLRLLSVSECSRAPHVVLPPAIFTQLCFGYRSLKWATAQPDVSVPQALIPVLNALFPQQSTWITGSDFF
jgi:GNAT superfamily N-acetyltransferase